MDGAVEMTPEGKYLIFWRAKCTITGREENRVSAAPFWPGDFEVMKQWVSRFFRHLELLEYRPWSSREDGHRIRYPVPPQHVQFAAPRPVLDRPAVGRLSLLVRNPLGLASMLRSATPPARSFLSQSRPASIESWIKQPAQISRDFLKGA